MRPPSCTPISRNITPVISVSIRFDERLRGSGKPPPARLPGLAALLTPCGRCGACVVRVRRADGPFQSTQTGHTPPQPIRSFPAHGSLRSPFASRASLRSALAPLTRSSLARCRLADLTSFGHASQRAPRGRTGMPTGRRMTRPVTSRRRTPPRAPSRSPGRERYRAPSRASRRGTASRRCRGWPRRVGGCLRRPPRRLGRRDVRASPR
jgi:hypothetical protein